MYPKGDPRNPLSVAELDAKFCDNASALVGEGEARALAASIRALPTTASVGELMRRLGAPASGAIGAGRV